MSVRGPLFKVAVNWYHFTENETEKLRNFPKVWKLVILDLETALSYYAIAKEKQDLQQMWQKICWYEKVEIGNMRYCPHRRLQLFWREENSLNFIWLLIIYLLFSNLWKDIVISLWKCKNYFYIIFLCLCSVANFIYLGGKTNK